MRNDVQAYCKVVPDIGLLTDGYTTNRGIACGGASDLVGRDSGSNRWVLETIPGCLVARGIDYKTVSETLTTLCEMFSYLFHCYNDCVCRGRCTRMGILNS